MRTKEELLGDPRSNERLIVEVLIDIRDILAKPKVSNTATLVGKITESRKEVNQAQCSHEWMRSYAPDAFPYICEKCGLKSENAPI